MKTPVQKFNLRMPIPMMEQAREQADALGISLNALVLLAVAQHLDGPRKQLRPPAAASRQRATSVRSPKVGKEGGGGHSAPAATPGPLAARAAPLPSVGPNDPCPCGSGRKAKRCHPEACGR